MSGRIHYSKNETIGECIFLKDLGSEKKKRFGLFLCNCGNNFKARITDVKLIKIISCGCAHKKASQRIAHNMVGKAEHNTWKSMKQRCFNTKTKFFSDYGGRGITVCDRWKNSFRNFYKDMGSRPSKNHSIERQNNDGDYEPNNCIWAIKETQDSNKRSSVKLTFLGETMCVFQWAKRLGFKKGVIETRIKLGWTIEKTLTTPVRFLNKKNYAKPLK